MGRYRFLVSALSLIVLASVQDAYASPPSVQDEHAASAAVLYSVDYPPAAWVAANSHNYTVANRPLDYPIDMIVIHDIEGTAASAIKAFQTSTRHASAHYVISSKGQITEMVREKNIAWHAGNWDYNTRAIGIEHEGFAYVNGSFTTAMYQASEHLIASICSRWGIPIDRNHVIGHYQVPDPNHPGLFGGDSHHTDPGPYWHWTSYINAAKQFAAALPSPPRMVLSAVGVGHDGSVTLSWRAARTCHLAIASYTIVGQPDNINLTVAGSAISTTIGGLRNGTTYNFTVTAHNSDGSDSVVSNPVIPMTVPDAPPPTVHAIAAGGSALLTWAVPAYNGGAAITGYLVTPYLNGVTAESPVEFDQFSTLGVVFNLFNDMSYTFRVAAINAAGIGAASIPSNSVIPRPYLRPPPGQGPVASPPAPTPPSQSSPVPSPPPR
jgi:N-acetyl-anhydromuramyl-L-alanine amidase AmpD